MTTNTQKGRPATFASNKAVAAALQAVQSNEKSLSRFLKLQLAEKGLLEAVSEQSGKRGRPRLTYQLTGKGRGLVALSKNWK